MFTSKIVFERNSMFRNKYIYIYNITKRELNISATSQQWDSELYIPFWIVHIPTQAKTSLDKLNMRILSKVKYLERKFLNYNLFRILINKIYKNLK